MGIGKLLRVDLCQSLMMYERTETCTGAADVSRWLIDEIESPAVPLAGYRYALNVSALYNVLSTVLAYARIVTLSWTLVSKLTPDGKDACIMTGADNVTMQFGGGASSSLA